MFADLITRRRRGAGKLQRIAFARIAQETNALSPVATTLHDFESSHYPRGRLRRGVRGPGGAGLLPGRVEPAFVRAARDRRAEIEPGADPVGVGGVGGLLARDCFEAFEARLALGLRRAAGLTGSPAPARRDGNGVADPRAA